VRKKEKKMKKILLCLCFVFAVGLLFSACGKDDTASGGGSTSMTSVQTTIDGQTVKFRAQISGDGQNNKWKLVGDDILIKVSAVPDGDLEDADLNVRIFLSIDNAGYDIERENEGADEGPLKALQAGGDVTSAIQLVGQYTGEPHFSNSPSQPQAGDYEKQTYKITSLLGEDCDLPVVFTIKFVDNF
jgi:hypothetical protein